MEFNVKTVPLIANSIEYDKLAFHKILEKNKEEKNIFYDSKKNTFISGNIISINENKSSMLVKNLKSKQIMPISIENCFFKFSIEEISSKNLNFGLMVFLLERKTIYISKLEELCHNRETNKLDIDCLKQIILTLNRAIQNIILILICKIDGQSFIKRSKFSERVL